MFYYIGPQQPVLLLQAQLAIIQLYILDISFISSNYETNAMVQ